MFGQINLKVKKNAINMIFAVTNEQSKVYEQLSKHIEGSTSGILSEDSSNVVELVQEQYDVSVFCNLILIVGNYIECESNILVTNQ